MPGFDGTGPMSAGPMSGGARGSCNPAGAAGAVFGRNRGYGRGFGGGRGCGIRARRCFAKEYPPYPSGRFFSPDDQINILERQANSIKNALEAINNRIAKLKQ